MTIAATYSREKQLKELRMPYISRDYETGGHGLEIGEDSDAEGWVDEAVSFWKSIGEDGGGR
ncbi:MAG TPA: hypothetical protein GXX75_16605 [Clostridiales bacterium]|nr:hypothetical protein [Clostridiales bacterium]